MHDPTRIPGLLSRVERLWEGQPQLSLGDLVGLLYSHGVNYGSSDADAAAIVDRLEFLHPAVLPLTVAAGQRQAGQRQAGERRLERPVDCLMLAGEGGLQQRVYCDDSWVVIRRWQGDGKALQPVAWNYATIRPAGPGRPLVISDSEGHEHRLGIVERIDSVAAGALTVHPQSFATLRTSDLWHQDMVLYTTADEHSLRIVVGERLDIFRIHRRDISHEDRYWQQLTCQDNQLRAQLGDGRWLDLGAVDVAVTIRPLTF